MSKFKLYTILAAGFIFLKIMLSLWVTTHWSLHRDALLYSALGDHLDWGYASVPPSIAFVNRLFRTLLGNHEWVLRVIAAICSALTLYLMGLIVLDLCKNQSSRSQTTVALLVAFIGLTCPAFVRTGIAYQPVVFDLFYWTLIYFLLLRFIKTDEDQYLYFFGIACGLGMLNKYMILLLLLGMSPLFLFSDLSRVWYQRRFYYSTVLALLIFLPNLLWQYYHNWPVVSHISELANSQFTFVNRFDIITDQILLYLPATILWVLGFYSFFKGKHGTNLKDLGWIYLIVLGTILVLRAKSYYIIGIYPLFIAGGLAHLLNSKRVARNVTIFIVTAIILASVALPFSFPILKKEQLATLFSRYRDIDIIEDGLRWEDGTYHELPQDYADMLGWKELAHLVDSVYLSVENKKNTMVYTENYGQASAIQFYGQIDVAPISFSDQYRYWLPSALPKDLEVLIYVNSELGNDMPSYFEDIQLAAILDVPMAREDGLQIHICFSPKPSFFEDINQRLQDWQNSLHR